MKEPTIDIVPAILNLGEIVFAVVGSKGKPTNLIRPDVYGTAFCVGPATFVTAGHVITSIEADGGTVTLAAIAHDPLRVFAAARTEVVKSHDLGLIGCMVNSVVPILDWQTEPLSLLSDVSTVGFPYAVTSDEQAFLLALRGFKGHVITRRKIWSVPGRPVGYEVSCRFPKGLSGAPLLASAPNTIPMLRLAGIVLGSGSAEIDGDVATFGEAVDATELPSIRSEIVGGTLAELRQLALTSRPTGTADFSKPILKWPTKSR